MPEDSSRGLDSPSNPKVKAPSDASKNISPILKVKSALISAKDDGMVKGLRWCNVRVAVEAVADAVYA